MNALATPPNFTLGNLPSLFTKANPNITQLTIEPVTGTDFNNVSGLSALNANDSVSVGGLRFNSSGGPVVIAERVNKRSSTSVKETAPGKAEFRSGSFAVPLPPANSPESGIYSGCEKPTGMLT